MRRFFVAVAAVLAALALPGLVLAGGWAVITLDSLPDQIEAGKTVNLGFTIRQHGREPANGLKPLVTATSATSRETLQAEAVPDGVPGHYVAALVFPSTGTWEWKVDPRSFAVAVMPPLSVVSSSEAAAADTPAPASASPPAAVWQWITVASGIAAATCLVLAAGMTVRERRLRAVRA